MAGKVIVITSGKGGVGKTTTTANLGAGLAMLGRRVCLVDADIGLRNLDVVMGLENRIVYDLVEVVEGHARLRNALVKDKRLETLYLLPAAQTREKDAVSPEQMAQLAEQLKAEFDYVLVDSPAGIEHGFRNAIAGADEAIIVCTPEVAAVRDADRIIGLLEANEIKHPKLIINRIRPRMVRKGDMMDIDDIIEILAIELLGVVPDDEDIIVATNKGEPIVLNQRTRPAQAYRNIVRRIEGEQVPFMQLEEGGFMDRVRNFIGIGRNRS